MFNFLLSKIDTISQFQANAISTPIFVNSKTSRMTTISIGPYRMEAPKLPRVQLKIKAHSYQVDIRVRKLVIVIVTKIDDAFISEPLFFYSAFNYSRRCIMQIMWHRLIRHISYFNNFSVGWNLYIRIKSNISVWPSLLAKFVITR